MALSYKARRRLALLVLVLGLPGHIVLAVTLVNHFERPSIGANRACSVVAPSRKPASSSAFRISEPDSGVPSLTHSFLIRFCNNSVATPCASPAMTGNVPVPGEATGRAPATRYASIERWEPRGDR